MVESESPSEKSPYNLEELTAARSARPTWRVDLVPQQIARGRLAVADLDTIRPPARGNSPTSEWS